ncbi:MAG: 3-deoxy-D-manno-octulosonic acid transferase, partial [Stenotrophomonas nitritireducens]|nr:3-deoxy-D-manno-octulosonic acid transferase [Stenotrophomonas nitritireducens]
LILETEMWPNLLFGCRDRRIPVYILNARLSARSLKGYRLLRPLVGRALRTVTCVAAQSSEDARRFVVLGARQEQVCALGNLKFDIHPPDPAPLLAAFHAHVPAGRVTWIAASTHEGEEQAVIDLHARVLERYPDALLLWAPRHPERFAKVEASVRAQGWRVATRSAEQWPGADTQVFVLNTLGELMPFFACAQVAFVGGSLQAIGGHNLLEPAAMGTAVITGPHLHNFAEISRRMSEAGALSICDDVDQLGDELLHLLGDVSARRKMVEAGAELVANGRGALERTLELIGPSLPALD